MITLVQHRLTNKNKNAGCSKEKLIQEIFCHNKPIPIEDNNFNYILHFCKNQYQPLVLG